MSRTRKVLRMFLASPSDVSDERSASESIVGEINRTVAPSLGILLELVRWEDVVPTMGRPQQVILDEVDIEASDIFVGILWNRFGSPTGRALSGTEEEFEKAYEVWQDAGRPRIMMYFCQRPANLQTEEDLKQKSLVIKFRKKISKVGLFRTYDSANDFSNLLRQDISKYLLTIERENSLNQSPAHTNNAGKEGRDSQNASPGTKSPAGMIRIPAGGFLAGRSARELTLGRDFFIDETPLTNKQYMDFVQATGYSIRVDRIGSVITLERIMKRAEKWPDHPITAVTWYDAQAYAAWVNKRLPTSMEWERAARGTDGRIYPWGNDFDKMVCNSIESGIGETTSVFSYPTGRSPEGCFDSVLSASVHDCR